LAAGQANQWTVHLRQSIGSWTEGGIQSF
jgi:hypothetical protein